MIYRMDSADARRTVIVECGQALGFAELKEKQIEVIYTFVSGHDTFVSLPTGYGKSVIFAALPLVFDGLRGKH